ncbi:hypothetical protein IAD21_00948 [Abditibacteriota bacterium]|nr:hypothetical protein IAD21_00948 [Abditibacteriota bacterium]
MTAHSTLTAQLRAIALSRPITITATVPNFAYLAAQENVPQRLAYRIKHEIGKRKAGDLTLAVSPFEAQELLRAAHLEDIVIFVEGEYLC